MPPPAKRVKATTYRRDSPEVTKLCRLIAETDMGGATMGTGTPSKGEGDRGDKKI